MRCTDQAVFLFTMGTGSIRRMMLLITVLNCFWRHLLPKRVQLVSLHGRNTTGCVGKDRVTVLDLYQASKGSARV